MEVAWPGQGNNFGSAENFNGGCRQFNEWNKRVK